MPPREWPRRVQDILDAIAKIQRYTAELTLDQFAADTVVVEAVLYNFGVIGEAVSAIPQTIKDAHPDIPWRRIREMRNVLVHVYFGVKLEVVWATVHERLTPLAGQLNQLLAEPNPPPP